MFEEMKQGLEGHYKPKKVVVAENFRFHRRSQAAEESLIEYATKLRRLKANCDFSDYRTKSCESGLSGDY